ncbi:MAG TPA: family 20 glycosylhydrolase [Candidatus Dormibacteraeota bacterium]|nr:family 20 glycosylhydrolase [Candidatus Dormibacteraeota bacterium]
MKRFNELLRVLTIVVLMAIWMPTNSLAQQATLNVMPLPSRVQQGSGSLPIEAKFSVSVTGYAEPRLERSLQRFRKQLARETGLVFAKPTAGGNKSESAATLTIHTAHGSRPIQELGEDESYSLEVTSGGAKLNAETPLGTMHGLQTFLQLIAVTPQGFAAPAVSIQDQPRFPWRGTMIDAGRHFMPMDVLRRNIDGMEAVKMNVFHWHLSENQGFRVESKKFPKLHEMGSDGLFYTQEEVREIIEYAHDRGIRVVPEFDVPGHSTAWFVGYPELAGGKGPYKIEERWGIFDPAFDPSNEKTYKFLNEFFGEMAKLFPDHFMHVGGDEVNGKEWDANPKIQEFIRANNLKNDAGLQSYFNKRLQAIITKHGKAMVGWDEVLDPSLPHDIVIQSWRGQASLAAAAKQGFRGILSNGYYLDLGWSAARHYAVDPMSGAAADLSPDEKLRILGGESCMWSEYVNAENVDSRIWPRNAAIAERLWSPQTVSDIPSMYARMNAEGERLEWLGLTHNSYYRQVLQRIAGTAAPQEFAALRTVTDLVEPVKDYSREQTATAEPTSATALNRVVDAVPLESDAGRRFNELVDRYLASSCHDESAGSELRAWLVRWRDNDAALQSLAQRSFLVQEIVPVSQELTVAAKIGVEAMDYLILGTAADAAWKTDHLAALSELAKPKAQLLLTPLPGIQKLVEATNGASVCGAK